MKKIAAFIASGSGMGADAAKYLASKGYEVAIMSSTEKAKKLAHEIGGYGYVGSNLITKNIEDFINSIFKKYNRLDVLVNSAGHGPKGEILEISDENWHEGMETYLLNVIRSSRVVTPIMKKQKNGSIINISSFAVFEPESNFPTSSVFRSGLAAFTKLYSDKFAKDNIRMNNILPGFIDSLPKKDEFLKRIPLRRYGRVSEISSVIELLASDGGAYITGQNIRVDGGFTRSV